MSDGPGAGPPATGPAGEDSPAGRASVTDGPDSAANPVAPGIPPVRQFALLSGVALVVGLIGGAGASAFIWVEHDLQHWLWHTLPQELGHEHAPVWLTVLLLMTGGLLTWLACRLPGRGGHSPLAPFALDITYHQAASAVLAALASLSFGAVLGPEAPLIALGTALGSLAVRNRPRPVVQIMMLSAAMAAVGAIFGNPLITVILLLEMAVMAGPPLTSLPVLLSALAALASGYILQVGIASWTGLGEAQLGVPGLEAYPEVHIIDVVVAVPMAFAVAVVGMAARLAGAEVESIARRSPLVTILGGAAIVGLVAAVVPAHPDEEVDLVLFSGQSAIPDYLALTSIGTALLVFAAKFVAYSISLGAGFRGGAIFPAIALGILTVSIIGQASDDAVSESALAAAAISAATAATMRLPFIATTLAVMLTAPAGGATTVTAIIETIVGLLSRMAAEQRFPGLAPAPREH